MDVDDSGIHVPHVDDFGLPVPVLVEDGVGADEDEDPDAHGEGPQHLHLLRVLLEELRHHTAKVTAHMGVVGGRLGVGHQEVLPVWPVPEHSHGDAHHQYQQAQDEEKAGGGVEADLAPDHHHVGAGLALGLLLLLAICRMHG